MPKSPAINEWDQLVTKMGELTIEAGYLEMAIIAMVCRILGTSEDDLGIRSNEKWCEKLKEVVPPSWSEAEKEDLSKRLKKIRNLYRGRNRMIHRAVGIVSSGLIPGVPPGSVVDLRTYGIGFTKRRGNTWTIGVVGKRVHLPDIARLTADLRKARLGLVPYMELVDKIKHPPRPFPMPEVGKRL